MRKLYKRFQVVFMLMGLLWTLCGCADRRESGLQLETEEWMSTQEAEAQADSQTDLQSPGSTETKSEIYVFVCGQVRNPGVYCLPAGSRVCDAVDAAGGCLETADPYIVNQAEILTDESRIYIPEPGETIDSSTDTGAVDADGRVSLNRASKEELMTLPGIGESKADSILEYREAHGGFRTIDELMSIPGIKEGVFQKIQDCIKVE